jgi:hypothetical protein
LRNFLQSPIILSHLGPNTLISTMFSITPSVLFFP